MCTENIKRITLKNINHILKKNMTIAIPHLLYGFYNTV